MATAKSEHISPSAQDVEQYAFDLLSGLARMADTVQLDSLASDLRRILQTNYGMPAVTPLPTPRRPMAI